MIGTKFTQQVGVQYPVIGGPMYPCSNPELVAAVSEAGGIGIIQPISLTYVHGYDFREGIRYIRGMTGKPIGMNALIEQSSNKYHQRMQMWVDIALEEGVFFYITSLGKPDWVVNKVHAVGGLVYHDVTGRKWAEKGLNGGVDGLIAVNERAGGHAGGKSAEQLYEELAEFNVPLICAGGIGDENDFVKAMKLGYAGVQMGTRFIATEECTASVSYKTAILNAKEQDIVHSERITGVPVAVINTPFIKRVGLKAGPIARWLLKGNKTKYLMRTLYALRSLYQLKHALLDEQGKKDYWQAGKSVEHIDRIEPVETIVHRFADRLDK
ncbi:MAG: nitronate monooxygenase family protein [Gammaproteobacteria bacterium]|nr:nitronate monooxygenase family protein [Gammaproteobacteria bacterium]